MTPFIICHRLDENGLPEVLVKEGNVELIRKCTIPQLVKRRREIDAILDAYAIGLEKIDRAGQEGLVAYRGIESLKYTG